MQVVNCDGLFLCYNGRSGRGLEKRKIHVLREKEGRGGWVR